MPKLEAADDDLYEAEIHIRITKNGQPFAERKTTEPNMRRKHMRMLVKNLIAMDQNLFDESE